MAYLKNLADPIKLRAGEIALLIENITKLSDAFTSAMSRLDGDKDHSKAWIDSSRSTLKAAYIKGKAQLDKDLSIAVTRFESNEFVLRNASMMLYGVPVIGSVAISDDAALRSDFRDQMRDVEPSVRREWFQMLVASGDLGRVGILAAMDPSLNEDALCLNIPGRDEALQFAAQIRGSLKVHQATERSARYFELMDKGNRSQTETFEMLTTAQAIQDTRDAEKAIEAATFTDVQSERYATLSAKGDAGTLTKPEISELMALADRLKRKQEAEAQLKLIKPAVSSKDEARFQELLAKPSLTTAEGHEVTKLGALMYQARIK